MPARAQPSRHPRMDDTPSRRQARGPDPRTRHRSRGGHGLAPQRHGPRLPSDHRRTRPHRPDRCPGTAGRRPAGDLRFRGRRHVAGPRGSRRDLPDRRPLPPRPGRPEGHEASVERLLAELDEREDFRCVLTLPTVSGTGHLPMPHPAVRGPQRPAYRCAAHASSVRGHRAAFGDGIRARRSSSCGSRRRRSAARRGSAMPRRPADGAWRTPTPRESSAPHSAGRCVASCGRRAACTRPGKGGRRMRSSRWPCAQPRERALG